MSLDLEKAKKLITQRANQLLEILVTQRSNDSPPFLSEEYAPLLGIKSIEKTDLGRAGGVLLRFGNKPKIKINKNDPPVRQNFSCAHELGHLLFSELKLENFINTIEHRTYNPQAQRRKRAIAIEKLCDDAATELLMPTTIFQKHLSEIGTSVNSIERLAEKFRVSIQSAAIRASEVGQEKCIVLKWVLQKSPSRLIKLSWPKNKLIDNVLFSPHNRSISPPSIFHEAYDNGGLLKGDISFKVGKQIKHFPAEIKSYGYGESRYVMSLVFLNG